MDEMKKKIADSMLGYARKLTYSTHPRTPESVFVGGTGIMDIPHLIDEFVRLWILAWEDKMKRRFILRSIVEPFLLNERFVTFEEYQRIFDESTAQLLFSKKPEEHSSNIDKLYGLYPIYRMLHISTPAHRQRFLNGYKSNIDGYFHLMGERNPTLRTIISQYHDTAIPKEQRVHTYITGATRFGKSELMKVLIHDNLVKRSGAIVVMDPLGGFIQEIAQFKEIAQNPDKLIYIDPSLHRGELVPVINPFEIEDKSDINVRITAEQIANSLIQIFDLEGQPLTTQMITVLIPCISVIIRHGGNLKDVQDFVEEKPEKEKRTQAGAIVQKEVKPEDLLWTKRGMEDPDHSEFFKKRFHSIDTFRTSKESLISKMQHLTNYPLVRHVITGKSTINLKKAIAEEKIILINLSVGKQGGIAPYLLGKFILAVIQDIIFQRAWIEKKDRKSINFYIDEFGDFANSSLNRILAQGGQFGFHLTVANQYLKQIEDKYRENLLANATVRFVGQNGHDTLSIMSKNLYIKEEELKKLDRGQFMTQINLRGKPFIITTSTKLLGDKNAMTQEQWQNIIEKQTAKYYRTPTITDEDRAKETKKKEPHNERYKQNGQKPPYQPKYN
mgnify:CR=1 FL=1